MGQFLPYGNDYPYTCATHCGIFDQLLSYISAMTFLRSCHCSSGERFYGTFLHVDVSIHPSF